MDLPAAVMHLDGSTAEKSPGSLRGMLDRRLRGGHTKGIEMGTMS